MSNRKCFMCNDRAPLSERMNLTTTLASHTKVTLPEKISQLIGDEYIVAVSEQDYACKKCGSMVNHMDKMETELLLVKRTIISELENKYTMNFGFDFGENDGAECESKVPLCNGQTPSAEQRSSDEPDSLRGPTIEPTSSAATLAQPVASPKKSMETPSKLKIYKCGFCSFQSRDLPTVRAHMKVHVKAAKNEAAASATAANPEAASEKTPSGSVSVRRRVFRCQVCAASFDERVKCLQHISKVHASAKKEETPQRQPAAVIDLEQQPYNSAKRFKLENGEASPFQPRLQHSGMDSSKGNERQAADVSSAFNSGGAVTFTGSADMLNDDSDVTAAAVAAAAEAAGHAVALAAAEQAQALVHGGIVIRRGSDGQLNMGLAEEQSAAEEQQPLEDADEDGKDPSIANLDIEAMIAALHSDGPVVESGVGDSNDSMPMI